MFLNFAIRLWLVILLILRVPAWAVCQALSRFVVWLRLVNYPGPPRSGLGGQYRL